MSRGSVRWPRTAVKRWQKGAHSIRKLSHLLWVALWYWYYSCLQTEPYVSLIVCLVLDTGLTPKDLKTKANDFRKFMNYNTKLLTVKYRLLVIPVFEALDTKFIQLRHTLTDFPLFFFFALSIYSREIPPATCISYRRRRAPPSCDTTPRRFRPRWDSIPPAW